MKTERKESGCETDIKPNKQRKTEFHYATMGF